LTPLHTHSVDVEDYWTCNRYYERFIIDEPSSEVSLITFYVFNVTNADEIVQRGYKPHIAETGPYGYTKNTFKYDVSFESADSRTISYKEYSYLEELSDPTVCERVSFRMDRIVNVELFNPCDNGKCYCIDHNSKVTIVNPIFLKLVWKESAQSIISQFSGEVFDTIKSYFEKDFPKAVRSHLVFLGMFEAYLFRIDMQMSKLIRTAFDYFDSFNNTYIMEIMTTTDTTKMAKICGLEKYLISTCPINFGPAMEAVLKADRASVLYANVTDTDYPSILPLLNQASNVSFLNFDHGLPMWIALGNYFKFKEFNSLKGHVLISTDELSRVVDSFAYTLLEQSFNINAANCTKNQYLASSSM